MFLNKRRKRPSFLEEAKRKAIAEGERRRNDGVSSELRRLISYYDITKNLDVRHAALFDLLYGERRKSPTPEEISDLGFPTILVERVLKWHEKYPEFLMTLLVCLLTGHDVDAAWGIAENI